MTLSSLTRELFGYVFSLLRSLFLPLFIAYVAVEETLTLFVFQLNKDRNELFALLDEVSTIFIGRYISEFS